MSTLDTRPTSPDVVDRLVAVLDELEAAGGELVITCTAQHGKDWTVQILTDHRGEGHPCDHGAQQSGRYLADALDDTITALREDQAA